MSATPPSPYAPPAEPAPAPARAIEIRTVSAGRGLRWIAEGFQFFAHHPGTWMGIVIIWFLLAMAINSVPGGSLAFYVLQPIFWGGLMLGCRAQERGEELELNHLFLGFRDHAGPLATAGGVYLGATLVLTLAMIIVAVALVAGSGVEVMALLENIEAANEYDDLPPMPIEAMVMIVMVVVLIGSLLGMLVLMALWFAPALIALDQASLADSLRLSFFGCLRNWLPFLVYGLVLTVLGVLAALPLMLGYLIVGPMFVASIHRAYRDIYFAEDESPDTRASP